MKTATRRNFNVHENLFFSSLNRFELLSIATKEGIWEYDFVTKQAYYNAGMTELFGYSHAEMEDNNTWWRNNIHPEERRNIIGELDELLSGTKTVWWGQYKFLCKNGEYKKVLDRLFVVRDEKGKPLRLIGTMQDLSELDALQLQVENLKKQHHKAMMKAIIEYEEKERREISEELHENINQILATINLRLSDVKSQITNKNKPELSEVQELLSYSIKEIRSIAKQLSPPTLKVLGLKIALEELLGSLELKKNIDYVVTVNEQAIKNIDPNIRTLLYRIAQLQVNNIEKHSDAKSVLLKITSTAGRLNMTISDDGTGVNVGAIQFGRGFSYMQERVEAFDGTFNLKSIEGENGFALVVMI